MARTLVVPLKARFTQGEPYDFGTHANDFLVRREQSRASETFLVRVPGGSAVPPHVHNDMEQTFLFLSGIGTVTLDLDGCERNLTCRPGDVLFVPTGWRHTVAAESPEGLAYLIVNAFVAEVAREGASAEAHAMLARDGFRKRGAAGLLPQQPDGMDPLRLFRTAETSFRPAGRRMWAEDFTAHGTTLLADPNRYRVRHIGPFECVQPVRPRPRILTPDLADRLAAAADGILPVLVEGSQSPLSVKQPCAESDLDLLVALQAADELPAAREVVARLRALQPWVTVPLGLGVVHRDWLRLPGFYSALHLDPASPDRRWWHASGHQRTQEAERRVRDGLALLGSPDRMEKLLQASLAVIGQRGDLVAEWRINPRWRGYQA